MQDSTLEAPDVQGSPWQAVAVIYLLTFVVLSILIFATPVFLGNDDYYHARAAQQLLEQKRLAIQFPWLPKTLLDPQRFVDHHLLFHLYIAPWVELGGIPGAKLATVSIAAGVFAMMWLLLRQIGVHHKTLWTLGLFGLSTPFLYRLLMVRTQGASLLLLLLSLWLLFRRQHRWLVIIGFAYVWLYNGFLLLPAIVMLYCLVRWLCDAELEWRPLAYVAVGTIAGLIINPYFPANIQFIAEHLGAKVDIEGSINVGGEWYPYTTAALLQNSAGALLAFIVGIFFSSVSGRKEDTISTTLLFVALLTLFMVLKSRRFIEYFPAFALLYCAARWGRKSMSWPAHLNVWRRGLIGLSLVTLFSLMGITLVDTYRSIQQADDDYFAQASLWLREHTPHGALIFQTDWDDFPQLFYHNTHNTYLVGLDPTYLQRANPQLWSPWVAITQGEIERPSAIIQKQFGAHYVISDVWHEAFAMQANQDPNMELVYRDKYSLIWRIIS
jgi:hypothetical protein